jgi:hypothetical protein
MATAHGGESDEQDEFSAEGGTAIRPSTRTCPNGHTNAWNYKFCGECGEPIAAALPYPDDAPPAANIGRVSKTAVLIAAAAAVAVAAAATTTYVLTRPSERASAPSPSFRPPTQPNYSAATPPGAVCTTPPDVRADSVALTDAGFEVRATFTASCTGGHVESNNALQITVADGDRDVAAGTFDFSAKPLAIEPDDPSQRTLVFPTGMYWRTPSMMSGTPELGVLRAGKPGAMTGGSAGGDSITASKPAAPAHGSIESVAEAVLREIYDSDAFAVRSGLINRWVPQVSSKRVGLVAEGRTWSSADILGDHLALRQRFDGARLLWSGDWSTFSVPDWWVTVVGPAHVFPAGANRWCDVNGFETDDCFAKFISNDFGVEGTTVYRE